MKQKTVLVRYGEIHLKGLNRPFFERKLQERLKEALTPFDGCTVEKGDGRYYVRGFKSGDEEKVVKKCCSVFGVHSAASTLCVDKDIGSICAASAAEIERAMREDGAGEASFKVRARRSDKSFPQDSMGICTIVGRYVLDNVPGTSVDVKKPKYFIDVEVRSGGAYIYTRIVPGVGGMPLGSNGRAILLLSGGIDSPVAGYMMAKRGVEIEPVHFHSFPYTGEKSRQKVIKLCRALANYTGSIKLRLVNLADIQIAIREKCPEKYLTLLMRRFMARLAEKIAQQSNADALVTGESLGQVASQTIKALHVTEAAVSLPVFKPCIGMDKQEIVDIAEKIGTYDISTLPYEDCCTLFVPRHPATRPELDEVEKAEAVLEVERLIEEALGKMETQIITVDS